MHAGIVGKGGYDLNTGYETLLSEVGHFEMDTLWESAMHTAGPVPMDEWTHIVATLEGADGKLYVNDHLDAESSLKPTTPNTLNLYIGVRTPGNAFRAYFDGLIDEIRVYNRIVPPEGSPPPTGPSCLTTTGISPTQVNLRWTDNSDNETGFAIERKPQGGSFGQIDTVGAGVTTYEDASLGAGNYCYRVRAFNAGGSSGYSNEHCASTTQASAFERMYWTDRGVFGISRADLSGAEREQLISGLNYIGGIAIDSVASKMYWTEPIGGTGKIQRADLAGTGIEPLIVAGLDKPAGIALDVANGMMYWADSAARRIQRAPMTPSPTTETLYDTGAVNGPVDVALDVSAGKIYWTEAGSDKIQRGDMDGTGPIEDLVTTGLSIPFAIALDVSAEKVYWTDEGTGKISRANLDGTCVEDLVTGLSSPLGIALDVAAGLMYWTDQATARIQRAHLDGTDIENLITSGLSLPRAIALGPLSVPPTKGDLDGDGVIGLKDVVFLFRAVILGLPLTPEQQAQADIDCDGDVDLTDVLILAEYAIGIRALLPC